MKAQVEEIISLIKNANTVINIDELTADANLRDIGADSLDMMNILLAIQEKYTVEVPDEDLEKLISVNTIYTYINQD